jgi:hypothetical protein
MTPPLPRQRPRTAGSSSILDTALGKGARAGGSAHPLTVSPHNPLALIGRTALGWPVRATHHPNRQDQQVQGH